jgi:hypothetical protein
LYGKPPSFCPELLEGLDERVGEKASEADDPNVLCRAVNKDKGMPNTQTTEPIAKGNVKVYFLKGLGRSWKE